MTEENTDILDEEFLYDEEHIKDNSSNIYDCVYNTVNDLREYIEENRLYLLDKLNYVDFFDYIEEVVKKT